MKYTFIFFLAFFFFKTNAQGNLQFNKVINMVNGDNLSVPSGKVWKIESINISQTIKFSPGSLSLVNCSSVSYPAGFWQRTCSYAGSYLNIGGVTFSSPTFTEVVNTYAGDCNGAPCPATNSSQQSTTSLNTSNFVFPIWLESGKNISVAAGSGILISIIEFNIVE